MKISVVMIDGGFRENAHGARYFAEQDFPLDEFEIIWVEHYDRIHLDVARNSRVRKICLDRAAVYHSSYCFNRGIAEATGEVIILPDADQIVPPDFVSRVWDHHRRYERLALYGYRHDEIQRGTLRDHSFSELEGKCRLRNPLNYGGCLSVRRHWLLEINGYEQHPIFQTGNHANGLDLYTRFKNLGLAIEWDPELILYHPWHPFTLSHTTEHRSQERLIAWRRKNLQTRAFRGIDPNRDEALPAEVEKLVGREMRRLSRESALVARLQAGAIEMARAAVSRIRAA